MRRLTLVPAIVMCLASPAIAEGQAGSLYLQLDGGAVYPAENEAAGLDIEYDIGFAVGGRIGYRATDTFDDEQFAHLLRLGVRYNP